MENVLRSMTLDFFGRGLHKTLPEKMIAGTDVLLLDVRSQEEAAAVSLPLTGFGNIESRNIPIHLIPDRLDEIPHDRPIVVFCPANVRASMVYAFLLTRGYKDVRILDGGYAAITDAVKPGKIHKALADGARREETK